MSLPLALLLRTYISSFLVHYPKMLTKTSIPFIFKYHAIPKNQQRIPREFHKNSRDFENITHVNFPIPYIALRGRKLFRACLNLFRYSMVPSINEFFFQKVAIHKHQIYLKQFGFSSRSNMVHVRQIVPCKCLTSETVFSAYPPSPRQLKNLQLKTIIETLSYQ